MRACAAQLLARGLTQLMEPDADVEAMDLVFELSYEVFGHAKTVELLPGGGSIRVTADNRTGAPPCRHAARRCAQHRAPPS